MKRHLPAIALSFALTVTAFNRGFFNFPSLILLVILIGILIYLYVKPVAGNISGQLALLKVLFLYSYVQFMYFSDGIYQNKLVPSALLTVLVPLFFPAAAYLLFVKS